MKSPLLKNTNFTQNFQQVVLRVQSIRRKNDQYQRLNAQQIDSAMAQQVVDEKHIMDKQISNTKKMIEQMDQMYKQPPQKNKLKQIRKQYEKQLSRYKQISQSLMDKSVIKAEIRSTVGRNSSNRNQRESSDKYRQVKPNRASKQYVAQQRQLDLDYTFQHKVLMQRKQQLGKVQKKFHQINQIHNDQQRLVYEQGDRVDNITSEMLKAGSYIEGVNSQLSQAGAQQKKSKKKLFCVIFIVLIVIIIGLGVAYILFNPTK